MTHKQTKARGFTIVELLIVIIVIAILAAITIVAYNGVQNRARTSANQSAAVAVQKKVEAFNAATGAYPLTTSSIVTQLNTVNESSLTGSGITIIATTPVTGTAANTVRVNFCTAPAAATGYQILYWDATAGSAATIAGGTNGTACTTYTAVTP
jgi:prepilin-type N-terminal cleavage/methylation domain-containing protein